MLERKIDSLLLDWKNNSNKKSLIIQGARQTGKTTSVRKFASENYENFIELNFISTPRYQKIFEGDLDVNTLIQNLSLYADGAKIVPYKTLLFLDEIQACPRARTALKFLTEDRRFDVIASGSMLGIHYKEVPSYPTGYVEFLTMYPLSFEEYLYAKKIDKSIIDVIRSCFVDRKKINDAMNDRLLEYFKEYMIVGGMPEAVDTFIQTSNFHTVLTIQQQILKDYINDIGKYAEGSEKVKATLCFNSIPAQLAKENKKFQYSVVEKNGSNNKYGSSVQWLVDSGIVNIAFKVRSLQAPLSAYKDESYFKLYMGDTGLLIAMLGKGMQTAVYEGTLGVYKGAIYENIISQMLTASDNPLYFYTRNNSLELDFLVTDGKGNTIPLEVKAENNKAKSLKTILQENPELKGIKFVKGNVGQKDNLLTLPLYMAMFL